MRKKILALIMALLLSINIVIPCFAIQGFGDYTITENNGQITVTVNTENKDIGTDRAHYRNSLSSLFIKYGKTLTWFTGIATITLVIIWVVCCVRLAFMASEHWMLRRQLTFALLWIGIAASLLGSTTLVLTLFQNALV